MTTGTCIMNLIIGGTYRSTCGGTGSGRMATVTVCGISYISCVVSICMLIKIGAMTVITITGRDICTAAWSNNGIQRTIGLMTG